MDIVGDVVGSETPEGKELLLVIARWEVAEGEAKACAERLREVEGSWHLAYNENLALRQDAERLTTMLDAVEKSLAAPTHVHRYTKTGIHSSDCFACRLRENVAECLCQGMTT